MKKSKTPKVLYRFTHAGALEQYAPIKGTTELVESLSIKGQWTAYGTSRRNVFTGYTTKKKAAAQMLLYYKNMSENIEIKRRRILKLMEEL